MISFLSVGRSDGCKVHHRVQLFFVIKQPDAQKVDKDDGNAGGEDGHASSSEMSVMSANAMTRASCSLRRATSA